MSRIREEMYCCVLCGTEYRTWDTRSCLVFPVEGAPDLDFRGPRLQRMWDLDWIRECSSCLYAAPRLDYEIPGAARLMRSDGILSLIAGTPQTCVRSLVERAAALLWTPRPPPRIPVSARPYLTYGLLVERTDPDDAVKSRVTASWLCDDEEAGPGASHCRALAIATPGCWGSHSPTPRRLRTCAILLDLMRRNERFEDALAAARELVRCSGLGPLREVVEFQIELSTARDCGAYSLDRVNPAWAAAAEEVYGFPYRGTDISERAWYLRPPAESLPTNESNQG